MKRSALGPVFLAVALAGFVGWLARDLPGELARARDLHQSRYVGSQTCFRCHPDHGASWQRTFHRTMTQAASEQSVRGDFSGVSFDYFGVRAQLTRSQDGGFAVRYASEDGVERRFAIEKTIGSRRYQQYVAREGDALVRLPVAYHLEEGRWFHMNGAFLTPDPALPLARADYERHLTRWNDNCVFCHNVAPNPGKRAAPDGRERFETEVAELGIGCEACHGPAQEHARINANPLRRFWLHAGDTPDPTIVNPRRLSPERAADVCGRCHGQRITDDVGAFLTRGDPFVPGEDLALYSAPLWHDTELAGHPGVFAPRFWRDGTPRLTAYEYQGMLLSACSQRGPMTCTDCHGMHEGDPRGQLREARAGAALCTGCHAELAATSAQQAHARHAPAATPSCVDCHMPPAVYGVLDVHPSHRVEVPDPARDAAHARPDACTLCHVDRTRRWAAEQRATLWQAAPGVLPAESAWSEVETQLFAGDPIARALAAHALGKRANTLAPTHAGRARRAQMLLDVMEHDAYPAVRRLAWRSLRSLAPEAAAQLAAYVPEATPAQRRAFVEPLYALLGIAPLPQDSLLSLRARAHAQAIDIGE